jgi:hypothetical protein
VATRHDKPPASQTATTAQKRTLPHSLIKRYVEKR